MNRRSFLSFLSVAPVAATCAGFMPPMASPEYVVGIDLASEADRLGVAYMRKTLSGWQTLHLGDRWLTPSEVYRLESLVTEQTSGSDSVALIHKTEVQLTPIL